MQFIVSQLQQLLESLRGSPVGFKLNIELNNFFLGIFGYHVNLWSLFLSKYLDHDHRTIIRLVNNNSDDSDNLIIAFFSYPFSNYCAVDQILVRTTGNIWMFGSLISIGHALWPTQHHNITCSLHLRLCGDVCKCNVTILNLSIYFELFLLLSYDRLFRIEVVGLLTLWRVVSGRRKNILKGRRNDNRNNFKLNLIIIFFYLAFSDRVESYEYTNSQLYLSAMFFTALLFLLPTFLAHYVVFASVSREFSIILWSNFTVELRCHSPRRRRQSHGN